MERKKQWVKLFLVLTVFQGCATMQADKKEVGAVHKVAIVGFGVQQRMPNTGEGVVKSLFAPKDDVGMMGGAKIAEIAKPSPHASRMYEVLARDLQQNLKWKVTPRSELVSNPAYASFFKEKTRMPQVRPFVSGKNMAMFHPEGVVEDILVSNMSFPERKALIESLHVDAIAIVQDRIELEDQGGLKNLVGAGEFHPRARLGFLLYDARHEDPIWKDLEAKGEPSDEGSEHALGFADVDALNRQAISATDSAIHQLIQRYDEK